MMKSIKAALLVVKLYLIVFFAMPAIAQENVLKIVDLNVRVIYPENRPADSKVMQIGFLINHASLADKIIIDFGSDKGLSDVARFIFPVLSDGANYYIESDGKRKDVVGYEAVVEVVLDKNKKLDWHYFSLHVQAKDGSSTEKLYFQK